MKTTLTPAPPRRRPPAGTITIADLFCGAGGTSTGALEAIEALGRKADLTAINHWTRAVETHTANHPTARHLCASLDSLSPHDLYAAGGLNVLWASPECTHHSVARGGKPINDQSRSTAWQVTHWATELLPETILVENVPEFLSWGPCTKKGKPIKAMKGKTFIAWKNTLESIGYKVEWRILTAADYGDPTTRKRLFVQAARGHRKIVWPNPTHSPTGATDLITGPTKRWVPARDIIDWTLPGQSIYARKRPLSPKTMRRIYEGLKKFNGLEFILPQQSGPTPKSIEDPMGTIVAAGSGPKLCQPFLITMEHGGGIRSADRPAPTITCAKGGAIGAVKPFLIKFRHDATGESLSDPLTTVTTTGKHHGLIEPTLHPISSTKSTPSMPVHESPCPPPTEPFLVPYYGDHAGEHDSDTRVHSIRQPIGTLTTENRYAVATPFLVEYYGNGGAESVNDPLNTVPCKDRHALVRPIVEVEGAHYYLDIRFRMLQPHELAAAQGFRKDYIFKGNKTEQVKQIGNAVPRNMARALVLAALSQQSNITPFLEKTNA